LTRKSKLIPVPRLLEIGYGVVDDLVAVLSSAAFDLRRPAIATGRAATREIALGVTQVIGCDPAATHADLDGHLSTANALARSLSDDRSTTVIAVGGGRVIDTAKHACAVADVPLVTVPTCLSHDGVSSPIASLVQADGRRRSSGAVMPQGVVVDLAIVKDAPPRTARAGAADLLSNVTAILDWRLAVRRGRDSFDGYSAVIAEEAASAFMMATRESASQALEALARGLVLSGLAMAAAGTSRPCSGAEHLVSHSLDEALGSAARLHGEQVSLGLAITAVLHKNVPEMLKDVYAIWNLPSAPDDLQLDRDVLVDAIIAAPATRPERYTILDEIDMSRARVEDVVERAVATFDSSGIRRDA
jgi:glycerol-1-phosphate dehydrogenase [NAD(P)+]